MTVTSNAGLNQGSTPTGSQKPPSANPPVPTAQRKATVSTTGARRGTNGPSNRPKFTNTAPKNPGIVEQVRTGVRNGLSEKAQSILDLPKQLKQTYDQGMKRTETGFKGAGFLPTASRIDQLKNQQEFKQLMQPDLSSSPITQFKESVAGITGSKSWNEGRHAEAIATSVTGGIANAALFAVMSKIGAKAKRSGKTFSSPTRTPPSEPSHTPKGKLAFAAANDASSGSALGQHRPKTPPNQNPIQPGKPLKIEDSLSGGDDTNYPHDAHYSGNPGQYNPDDKLPPVAAMEKQLIKDEVAKNPPKFPWEGEGEVKSYPDKDNN